MVYQSGKGNRTTSRGDRVNDQKLMDEIYLFALKDAFTAGWRLGDNPVTNISDKVNIAVQIATAAFDARPIVDDER